MGCDESHQQHDLSVESPGMPLPRYTSREINIIIHGGDIGTNIPHLLGFSLTRVSTSIIPELTGRERERTSEIATVDEIREGV
jgi:hypothetical protein